LKNIRVIYTGVLLLIQSTHVVTWRLLPPPFTFDPDQKWFLSLSKVIRRVFASRDYISPSLSTASKVIPPCIFVEKFVKINLETSSKCCTLAIWILLDRGVTQHQNTISMSRIIVIIKTEFNHFDFAEDLKNFTDRRKTAAIFCAIMALPYAGFFSFLFQEILPSLQAVGWTTWIT